MFRDKEFLIEKGMYPNCREDVFYIVGILYDEVMETGIINIEKIEELREFLDSHRELIDNKTYSIALPETIIKRFKESFIDEMYTMNNIETEYQNTYNIQQLLENQSIRKISVDWESKTGIYGIFTESKLVYIGSTHESFKARFMAHRAGIKGKSTQYVHKKIKEDLNNNKRVEFKPIIIIEDLQMMHKKTINLKELKCMELALIVALQPSYNIEGVLKPFSF